MEILSDFLIYSIDPNQNLLFAKWLRPVSSTEYRTGIDLMHKLILSQDAKLWFLDYTTISTPDKEDQAWTIEEAAKLIACPDCRLDKIAIVVSKDAFFLTVAKQIHNTIAVGQQNGLAVEHFTGIAVAFKWLTGIDSEAMDAPATDIG